MLEESSWHRIHGLEKEDGEVKECSWVKLDDHQQIAVRTSRCCSLAQRLDSSQEPKVELYLHATLLDDVPQTIKDCSV